MIIPIELRFKADKDSKSAFRTDKTIKSHDVNSVEFHISIEGLELTDNHTAKVLSIFHSSESQSNVDCEIVEGKIIYKPDTNLISRHEHVTNYVYVYNGNQSLDVREFIYVVDLSKIDETSLEVKEVYDQSYADLLADFEQALEDYKLTLPQADSVRAEIDVILNQFSVDSQAKLSQYDTDVQQVVADVTEAESSRVQAEGQRISAESSRVQSETQRVSAESSRVSAESERVLAEDERENAEVQRKTDHANRSAELAGKVDKKQEDWIKPTLLNGWTNKVASVYAPAGYYKDELGIVHLRGYLTKGVSGVIFELPVGYRPKTWVVTPASTNWYGGNHTLSIEQHRVNIRINESGAYPAVVHLGNISFRAEA